VDDDEVRREIRKFIIDNFLFGDEGAAPSYEQPLVKSGVLDSTGILEIVDLLEMRWNVKTSDDELAAENFGTIDAIAAFVVRKTALAA
jgi:acyl carrier protein